MFTIQTLSNRVIKAGALVNVESFIITDSAGALLAGSKAYDTREEAQAKIDSLGNFSAGLEFAKAAFPELSDKAQVGKANTVAQYLDWIAAGKPVSTVEAKEEEATTEQAEDPVDTVASSEEEEF